MVIVYRVLSFIRRIFATFNVVLLDLDGIVVKGKKGRFSERISSEYGAPIDSVLQFIKNEYALCKVGKADLRVELEKYTSQWNWPGSVDELMAYWFHGETELNEKIIKVVTELRNKGIKVYLASDNEKYRAEYILNDLGVKNYFDGHFFSYEVGYRKPEAEYYPTVLEKLSPIKPEEVMLWDDKESNLVQARNLGINTKLFTATEKFLEEMSKSL
jgi:putative hydrolase of the HAD superfamily